MERRTAEDIFHQFAELEDVVLKYGHILQNIKAPSVVYEEKRMRLRSEFTKAGALYRTAQTDLQWTQEELMVQLAGQIRDLDCDFKERCVTYNRDWEARLQKAMDELRCELALILSLPDPLQNQMTTDLEAETQTEQRKNDSDTAEEVVAGNTSNDLQPDGTRPEHRENDSETRTQTEQRETNNDLSGETAAGNASNDPQPDQHETTMHESVRGNSPDDPVSESSPLTELDMEQCPTFDDEEDSIEANGTDHDTNHTAEDVTVDRGETTNFEEDPDETMQDASAENDNETSSSDGLSDSPSDSPSDSDDEPMALSRRRRVSNRTAGDSIEVLLTPARQTRSSMAHMSSPRATGSSTLKEPLRTKRRAPNTSPPPTSSKRLRGGAGISKKTNDSPRQPPPAPRESSKPTESPAGGSSRNTTRELLQKRGSKSVDSSTRVPRRRSQRHTVDSGENGEFHGILNPTPGKVYTTYWEKTKSFLAVIVLPMGDFSSIRFEGSIDSCGLPENPCYTKNRKGEYILAKGYRDGEELEKERMFPLLYIDGSPFPEQCPVAWCAGKDLRKFRAEDQLVPYMKMVRRYLESRGYTENTQDSDFEAEPAGTESVAHEDSEAERARTESEAHEIEVAEFDDDYIQDSDPDTEPEEDLDALELAQEDIDMADETTGEPSNTTRRNQQQRADRRENDGPTNETREPERPSEPAEIPATTSPSDEPLTEASALDEPLVGEHVNFTRINERVRDVPRTEQRDTRPSIKEEKVIVILTDSEDENDTNPASNAEHHSTGRRPLSHIFPFETPDRASYPPIGTFRHSSMAASPGESAPPARAEQEPSQGRPQQSRSQIHQLLNDPQQSHYGRSEPVSSAQPQRQISNRQPDPPTRAVPSRRDSSRIRIDDILSPKLSSETSGSAQHAQREIPPSTLQESALEDVNATLPGTARRSGKACKRCRRLHRRCDPKHCSNPDTRSVTAASASSQPAAHSRSESTPRHSTSSASPSLNSSHDRQLPQGTSSPLTSNSPGNSSDYQRVDQSMHTDERTAHQTPQQASQSTLFKAWLRGKKTTQSAQNEMQSPPPNSHLQEQSASAVASPRRGPSQTQKNQGPSNEDVDSISNHPPVETLDEFIYEKRGHLPPDHSYFHETNVLPKPRILLPLPRTQRCPPGLARYLRGLVQANDSMKEVTHLEDNFQLVDEKGHSRGYWCPFCKASNCHRRGAYPERGRFVAHCVVHWRKAGGS
ncbi:hypothetical protein NW768_008197 [Fusarium equiseti]|uniref:Transcription factor n=1 Tax=Fusarium equiseti TaxID=61235 RepID=A0ABQ8R626_FUSEQ|nr:hypothetical protein NW768_008197 [Fusarium equiseti]